MTAAASAQAAVRGFVFRRAALGWRGTAPLAVSALPALVAFVFLRFGPARAEKDPSLLPFYGEVLAPMCLYFVLPLVSMLVTLPVLGELYEKGAIGYWFTRPVRRGAVLLGCYGGTLLAALPFLALAAALPALLLWPHEPGTGPGSWALSALAQLLVLCCGAVCYGAACLFAGVWSRKAVLWALGLLLGWGTLAGSLPGALRAWSPHRYLFALLRSWSGVENTWQRFSVPDPDPPGDVLSLAVLGAYTALFLLLAWGSIRRRDVL